MRRCYFLIRLQIIVGGFAASASSADLSPTSAADEIRYRLHEHHKDNLRPCVLRYQSATTSTMFLRTLAFTALAVETVSAFRDASPFFMFSTSELVPRHQSVTSRVANSWSRPASSDSTHSRVDTVATSSSVQDYVQDALAGCQSDTYILVNQPAVSAADFSTTTHATIHLRQRMTGGDQGIKTRKTVSNVLGQVALGEVERSLIERCGATSLVLDLSLIHI